MDTPAEMGDRINRCLLPSKSQVNHLLEPAVPQVPDAHTTALHVRLQTLQRNGLPLRSQRLYGGHDADRDAFPANADQGEDKNIMQGEIYEGARRNAEQRAAVDAGAGQRGRDHDADIAKEDPRMDAVHPCVAVRSGGRLVDHEVNQERDKEGNGAVDADIFDIA